jgi:gamma-D-glutamyl-L-lysine dipeptidyl-peptidase
MADRVPSAPTPTAVAADADALAAHVGVAFIRSAVAPLHTEPRVSSAQTSQRLAGHPVYVLEERGDWLRVRGLDDYEGWVHRGYLMPVAEYGPVAPVPPGGEFALTFVPRVSLGARVRSPRGGPRALPLGAWLDVDEEVEEGSAVPLDVLARRFPAEPDAIIQSAATLFAGTRYEWGGITPWGADCSGFVQSVFGLHGVALPRDAWQQALEGTDAGRDVAALRAADLLFFSERPDGRVTHVGIALGGPRMAHVALGRGGFSVERLDDSEDPYVVTLVGRLTGARRVL